MVVLRRHCEIVRTLCEAGGGKILIVVGYGSGLNRRGKENCRIVIKDDGSVQHVP